MSNSCLHSKSSLVRTVRGRGPSSNASRRASLRCSTFSMLIAPPTARSAGTTIAVGEEERGTHGSHVERSRRVAAQPSRAHTPSGVEPLRGLSVSSRNRGFAALTHAYCCFGRYAPGGWVMSLSPVRAGHAHCDAGGVMEISRWSSELGERTPPDHRHQNPAPRRVGRKSSGGFRHPIRGAFLMRCDPVVFARASLDHRLISVHPPGEGRHSPSVRDRGRSECETGRGALGETRHPRPRISLHFSD